MPRSSQERSSPALASEKTPLLHALSSPAAVSAHAGGSLGGGRSQLSIALSPTSAAPAADGEGAKCVECTCGAAEAVTAAPRGSRRLNRRVTIASDDASIFHDDHAHGRRHSVASSAAEEAEHHAAMPPASYSRWGFFSRSTPEGGGSGHSPGRTHTTPWGRRDFNHHGHAHHGSFTEKSFMGLPSWDEPGREPGIDDLEELDRSAGAEANCAITVFEYGPDGAKEETVAPGLLAKYLSREKSEGTVVRWIRVDGLDKYTMQILSQRFGFNDLQTEDVFQVPQRPKVDLYGNNVFVVANLLKPGDTVGTNSLRIEQVSLFLVNDAVITVREHMPPPSGEGAGPVPPSSSRRARVDADVWRLIRERIFDPTSSLRLNDASFLAYALIDAIVDHAFPVLEMYQAEMEHLDDCALEKPDPMVIRRVHGLERELLLVRRIMHPMRDLVDKMQKAEHALISTTTKTYLMDVRDHTIQIIDIIDNFRDFGSRTRELAITMISNRLNEVMKVLTMISTLFIPLSFIAGVYGMNFPTIPEIHWDYGYEMFWGICCSMAMGMLLFFYHKNWLTS